MNKFRKGAERFNDRQKPLAEAVAVGVYSMQYEAEAERQAKQLEQERARAKALYNKRLTLLPEDDDNHIIK